MSSTTQYNATYPIIRCRNFRKKRFTETLDEKLNFSSPTEALSTECICGMINSSLWKIEADQNKIVAFLPNKYTSLYIYAQLTAYVYLTFFFPLFLLGNVIIGLAGPQSFFTKLENNIPITIAIFSIALLAVTIYTIVGLHSSNTITLPKCDFIKYFEINREKGTVTCYHKKQHHYTTPFIDFDCHLRPTMGKNGITYFSLHLINLTLPNSKEIILSKLFIGNYSDQNIYYRLWNTIQWYMDVSRPLPDLPILEKHRSKDPLTAAHDKTTGRKKNFWEDMTEKEFDEYIELLDSEQKNIPPLGRPLQIQYIESKES